MPKEINIPEETLRELYINQNKSTTEIAEILGHSRTTICKSIKKYNIKKSEDQIREKIKQTNLERFGCECPAKNENIKNKIKETNLKKYGAKCTLQNEKVKEKRKETWFKKYGDEHPLQNKDIRNKIKETNLKKYGCEHPSQNEDIKLKKIETSKKRYGVEYTFQNEDIKKKIKETNLERYGVECVFQNKDIRNKIRETNLEKYGCENVSQSHLSKETIDILNNKDKFISFLESISFDKRTSTYCCELLKYSESSFLAKAHEYDCYNLINHSASNYELEIQDLYRQKGIDLYKTKAMLDGKEIDLYNDKYKVGIEFNGNYWHSDKKLDKLYHQNKSLLAEEKGIHLIQIWETDWIYNKDKCISMLDNLFGLSKPIYARKCIIKEINSSIKSAFLNNNHFQGNDHSSVNLGLYNNSELVSVMTFCKPRFNKNYEWELSRFCNLAGHRVIGGASKLLKYFIKNYNPKSIISYSNIARTSGNLYKQLGFNLLRIAEPNYIWCNGNLEFKTRYQCQMKNEVNTMMQQGYWKNYDCGNKVWVLNF